MSKKRKRTRAKSRARTTPKRGKRQPSKRQPKQKPVAATPPEHGRASSAKIELRVLAILQLQLDGAQPWDVCRFVSEKEQAGKQPWKMDADAKPLCQRTIERYMTLANERIDEACATQAKNLLFMHVARLRNLYARAMELVDLPTALAVAKELAKTFDLYPVPKKYPVEISGRLDSKLEVTDYRDNLTDEERQQTLMAIITRVMANNEQFAEEPAAVPDLHDAGSGWRNAPSPVDQGDGAALN